MKTNRFDKLLSTLTIVAVAVCIVSLFEIVFYYFWRIARLPGGVEYWNQRFHMRVTIFALSLFLGLGCLAVYRIRKKTKNKSRKRHDPI
jgi:hypothetical protein